MKTSLKSIVLRSLLEAVATVITLLFVLPFIFGPAWPLGRLAIQAPPIWKSAFAATVSRPTVSKLKTARDTPPKTFFKSGRAVRQTYRFTLYTPLSHVLKAEARMRALLRRHQAITQSAFRFASPQQAETTFKVRVAVPSSQAKGFLKDARKIGFRSESFSLDDITTQIKASKKKVADLKRALRKGGLKDTEKAETKKALARAESNLAKLRRDGKQVKFSLSIISPAGRAGQPPIRIAKRALTFWKSALQQSLTLTPLLLLLSFILLFLFHLSRAITWK